MVGIRVEGLDHGRAIGVHGLQATPLCCVWLRTMSSICDIHEQS